MDCHETWWKECGTDQERATLSSGADPDQGEDQGEDQGFF